MNAKISLISGLLLIISLVSRAHPMPATQLLMDIDSKGIHAELCLPVNELQLALGEAKDVSSHAESLVARDSAFLAGYVLGHMRAMSDDGTPWAISINRMDVTKAEQDGTGPFRQLRMQLWMQPPDGRSPRSFRLYYDVIMHQLVTHKALVAIRQDWLAGQTGETQQTEIGYIYVNTADNSVTPLNVHLDKGSNWRGFKSMVSLGIRHISEGTDHLLFLLVLLLPAPLMARNGRWAESGGTRYSVLRLIKIATSFTIGHSMTLLAGALGWLRLPSQPVEILIAVSILVTAIHAIRPIFPGREIYVAAGFGLVHGLAFATVLANLQLEGGRMALSILGFNMGIELMQLFVIILIVPWLLILSTGKFYGWLRVGGAIVAAIAALAWIAERCLMRPNAIAGTVQKVAVHGKWLVLGLACCAVLSYFLSKGTMQDVVD